jgi:hypothetical protein
MIMDSRLEFADAVALNTGAAGTYLIGSQVDLGADGVNDVDGLYLVVNVDTAATSGGSATLQISLASDDTASISTTTSTIHYTSPAIPVASLTAGYFVCKVELPKGTYERYLGILQVTGTAAFTAGKVNAFLTNDPYTWKSFADATN